MYSVIKQCHTAVGHGGLHKTYNELKKHYANISREILKVFLKMCNHCALKKKRSELSKLVIKPVTSSDFNSRGQVDLIDYQSASDKDYKWVFHYQDHLTKFSILRPLKTKTAAEVAYNLLDVFLLIGAPKILQSDNGREFTANIISELKSMWPDLVIVHGRPRHPQSQGSVERANADVKEMLATWMHENNINQWSEGLRFVQFQKNRSFHRVIGQSPYNALFGADPKVGLSSSNIPKELLSGLETEEDLQHMVDGLQQAESTDTDVESTEEDENIHSDVNNDINVEADTVNVDNLSNNDNNLNEVGSGEMIEIALAVNTDIITNIQTETLMTTNAAHSGTSSITETDIETETTSMTINDTHLEMETESTDSNNETNANSNTATATELDNTVLVPEISATHTNIVRARKRALSGQQTQAELFTKVTKTKLSLLEVGDNVIIPIPSVDRGPADERNIKGIIVAINDNGGYKVGTNVGKVKGFMSRNQVECTESTTLSLQDVPDTEMSLREIVSKVSLSGGQGYFFCNCKKGNCKSARCKCRKSKVLCNSKCHNSVTCSNK